MPFCEISRLSCCCSLGVLLVKDVALSLQWLVSLLEHGIEAAAMAKKKKIILLYHIFCPFVLFFGEVWILEDLNGNRNSPGLWTKMKKKIIPCLGLSINKGHQSH